MEILIFTSAIIFILAFIASGILSDINYHVPYWLTAVMIFSAAFTIVSCVLYFGQMLYNEFIKTLSP